MSVHKHRFMKSSQARLGSLRQMCVQHNAFLSDSLDLVTVVWFRPTLRPLMAIW